MNTVMIDPYNLQGEPSFELKSHHELQIDINDEFEAMLAGQTALGRVGEPDDVGVAIAGLLSDDSRWINAQSIEIAGGYII
jgi:NAD(P)-dependent dehydrogenase (short-subunit alcohol dehydrogenase family)